MPKRKSCKYEESIIGQIMSKEEYEQIYLSYLKMKFFGNMGMSPQEEKDYIAMTEPKKEKLIKSKDRVKKFAEVYTPERIVNEMLDMVEPMKLESTFLEPACGNGNFLVKILERKLKLCHNADDIISAIQSIYGIDLLADNVEESKKRMFELICKMIMEENIQVGNFLKPETLEFVDWINKKIDKDERCELTLL
jgi:type I restriction-modification system DNA methylase subunit